MDVSQVVQQPKTRCGVLSIMNEEKRPKLYSEKADRTVCEIRIPASDIFLAYQINEGSEASSAPTSVCFTVCFSVHFLDGNSNSVTNLTIYNNISYFRITGNKHIHI